MGGIIGRIIADRESMFRGQSRGAALSASLHDYRWLVSEAAEHWLAIASQELAGSRGTSVSLLGRLRKELGAERAHLVVMQIELRHRAREKFSSADRMFFCRKGLEQATDEQLALYKAGRFPADTALADLCCGIGGDIIGLVRRGTVTGVDLEPAMALLAGVNAAAHGANSARCQTLQADAAGFPVESMHAWHCDPDRRPQGRRTTRVELYQPPLAILERKLIENRNAAIKLAPAAEAPPDWREAAELEWLGSRGECRQQVAWFGALARHRGKHSATIVGSGGTSRSVVGAPDESISVAQNLERYLYEPHAAVLAANLSGSLCREYVLAIVSAGGGYLTGSRLIDDPALSVFEINDVLPLDRRRLRAYCREHRIGRLEVKKRGVKIDPARLRREIVGAGEREATLIVTPCAGQLRAIMARRIIRPQAP
jgi:hypothetical protein